MLLTSGVTAGNGKTRFGFPEGHMSRMEPRYGYGLKMVAEVKTLVQVLSNAYGRIKWMKYIARFEKDKQLLGFVGADTFEKFCRKLATSGYPIDAQVYVYQFDGYCEYQLIDIRKSMERYKLAN